jgi:ATP-dependent DNA ligase
VSRLPSATCHLSSAFRFLPSAFYILPMPKFPEWIQPMAATLTQERFTGPEWIFERKFDGIRLLAYKRGAKVELFSRNRLPQNIPALARAIAQLPHRELILDGEIDWHGPTAYHVFDILWIDGRDVTKLPLEERQALLKKLPLKPPLHRVTALKMSEPGAIATGSSDNIAVGRNLPWEYARERGWEGVIAKRRGSIYEPRRSPNWLKMKVELSQEFVVGGFTDPQGKRVGLGALLVGYYEYASVPKADRGPRAGSPRGVVDATGSTDGTDMSEPPTRAFGSGSVTRPVGIAGGSVSVPGALATGSSADDAQPHFIYAGKIGTGFNTQMLLDLRTQLDKIEIAKTPFTKAVGLPRLRTHWVRPKVVVQVGFIQWTKYGKLRHPRLLAVRTDKDPREVVRE